MTEQILNGCQQRRPLRQRAWYALKHQALKRSFCTLYVCLQGILFCGALEAAPTPPDGVRPEGFNCKQMPVVAVQDNSTRSVGTANEPKQGISERAAKCSAGNGNSVGSVVSPSNETCKRSKQDGAKDGVGVGQEGFNHFAFWIYVLIALMPIWMSGSSMQPNVFYSEYPPDNIYHHLKGVDSNCAKSMSSLGFPRILAHQQPNNNTEKHHLIDTSDGKIRDRGAKPGAR